MRTQLRDAIAACERLLNSKEGLHPSTRPLLIEQLHEHLRELNEEEHRIYLQTMVVNKVIG